jgi:ABC-2 type transport system permease protein
MGILLSAALKMVVRDRQAIFWALAFPMIFLGVFRLFSFDQVGTTDLAVGADPADPTSAALIRALQDVSFLDVSVHPDLVSADAATADEAARRLMDDGDADLVLIVRPGNPSAEATLVYAIRDPIGSSISLASVRSVIDEVNLALIEVPRPIELSARSVDAQDTSYFQFLGPGIIGMGLMTFATISLAGSLSRYREEGVLRRIRATPLQPWRFFASVVGAHLGVAVVQVLILALVAEALGADVLRGGIWFLLVAILGVLVFLNIGVIIAGRVQSRGGVEGAANAVTLPMMFLSGSFFPTSSLPEMVQPFVQALPLTHMLTAMRGLTIRNEGIVEQLPAVLILAGWAVATFVAARYSFSFKDA